MTPMTSASSVVITTSNQSVADVVGKIRVVTATPTPRPNPTAIAPKLKSRGMIPQITAAIPIDAPSQIANAIGISGINAIAPYTDASAAIAPKISPDDVRHVTSRPAIQTSPNAT